MVMDGRGMGENDIQCRYINLLMTLDNVMLGPWDVLRNCLRWGKS